jgi:hypothetical protein
MRRFIITERRAADTNGDTTFSRLQADLSGFCQTKPQVPGYRLYLGGSSIGVNCDASTPFG